MKKKININEGVRKSTTKKPPANETPKPKIIPPSQKPKKKT